MFISFTGFLNCSIKSVNLLNYAGLLWKSFSGLHALIGLTNICWTLMSNYMKYIHLWSTWKIISIITKLLFLCVCVWLHTVDPTKYTSNNLRSFFPSVVLILTKQFSGDYIHLNKINSIFLLYISQSKCLFAEKSKQCFIHKTTKTAAFSFYTLFYLIQSHQFNDIKFVIYTAFEKKWFISTL